MLKPLNQLVSGPKHLPFRRNIRQFLCFHTSRQALIQVSLHPARRCGYTGPARKDKSRIPELFRSAVDFRSDPRVTVKRSTFRNVYGVQILHFE
jgi:hypothetical protein